MRYLVTLAFLSALSACAAAAPEQPPKTERPAPAAAKQNKPAPVSGVAAYMTKQEEELKAALEGTPFILKRYKNILVIVMAGKDIFASNSYHPEAPAVAALKKIAPVLAHYDKTRISIIGYTDNAGKPSTNQLLSEKRADAVASVIEESAKIADIRFWIEGRGAYANSRYKIAGGKDKNDRVEISLTPIIR